MAEILNPPVSHIGVNKILFTLIGANLNSALTDQAFTPSFTFNNYRITEIWITNVSASLVTMTGTLAVRTATAGGGTAIVAAQNLTALATPTNMIVCTIANSDIRNTSPLYARLSAALGSSATADIYINGTAIS